MNIAQKLARALPVIDSIGDHTDGDSTVRIAALNQIKAACDAKIVVIEVDMQAQANALVESE